MNLCSSLRPAEPNWPQPLLRLCCAGLQGEVEDLGLGPGRSGRFEAGTKERWEIWGLNQGEVRFGAGTRER